MQLPSGQRIKIDARNIPDAIVEAEGLELTGYLRFMYETGEILCDFYFLMDGGTVVGVYATIAEDELYGSAVHNIDIPQNISGSCDAQVWSRYTLETVLAEYPATKIDGSSQTIFDLESASVATSGTEIASGEGAETVTSGSGGSGGSGSGGDRDHGADGGAGVVSDEPSDAPATKIAGIRIPRGRPYLTGVDITGADLLHTIEIVRQKKISGYARITLDLGRDIADGYLLFCRGEVRSALFESRSETAYGDDALIRLHSLFGSSGIMDVSVLPDDTIKSVIESATPISGPVSEVIKSARARVMSRRQEALDHIGIPTGSMTTNMRSQDIYSYEIMTRNIAERKTSGYLWAYGDHSDLCGAVIFDRGSAKGAACYNGGGGWLFGDEAMDRLRSILMHEAVIEMYELQPNIQVPETTLLTVGEPDLPANGEGIFSDEILTEIQKAAKFRERFMGRRGR